jgi:hypothetical protein
MTFSRGAKMKIRYMSLLVLALAVCSGADAADRKISISADAKFRDEKIIAPKILSECSALGAQFSAAAAQGLQSSGWEVEQVADVTEQTKGKALKLEITHALSAGNAFMGHHKSVAVAAGLYVDGVLVDTFAGTRESAGGITGGFKGSCAVLQRCVNTLGSDLAKWLNAKNL